MLPWTEALLQEKIAAALSLELHGPLAPQFSFPRPDIVLTNDKNLVRCRDRQRDDAHLAHSDPFSLSANSCFPDLSHSIAFRNTVHLFLTAQLLSVDKYVNSNAAFVILTKCVTSFGFVDSLTAAAIDVAVRRLEFFLAEARRSALV